MTRLEPDALDRLLSTLEVQVRPFTICDVREGWRIDFDPLDCTHAHIVVRGRGSFLSEGATYAAEPQGLLIVPAGHRYSVMGQASVNHVMKVAMPDAVAPGTIPVIRAGDGPPGVLTACGTLRAIHAGMLDLLENIPRAIVQRIPDADLLTSQIERLIPEIERPRPGTRALIESVLKQCLILLLRIPSTADELSLPWSRSGRAGPALWRAFTTMTETLDAPHRLDDLASVAGMSRSAFAEHFAKAFGKTPMAMLREMRLRRAADLLKGTSLPVEAVARQVGYTSRSQFSHSFREFSGLDPKTYRAQTPADAPARPKR